MMFPKASRVESRSYRQWVASLDCAGCGISGYSQCAHREEGKGMSMKTCDLQTFPLCCVRPGHMGCHYQHTMLIDMDRDTRRELEARYVQQTQAAAVEAGRREFKVAA